MVTGAGRLYVLAAREEQVPGRMPWTGPECVLPRLHTAEIRNCKWPVREQLIRQRLPSLGSRVQCGAKLGGATGARAGAQSHLRRALVGADSNDPLWARFQVHVDLLLLQRRQGVRARRHRGPSTRGGVFKWRRRRRKRRRPTVPLGQEKGGVGGGGGEEGVSDCTLARVDRTCSI
eukprot:scaffold5096_cov116-Isochrysis_galbana.AAC.7